MYLIFYLGTIQEQLLDVTTSSLLIYFTAVKKFYDGPSQEISFIFAKRFLSHYLIASMPDQCMRYTVADE